MEVKGQVLADGFPSPNISGRRVVWSMGPAFASSEVGRSVRAVLLDKERENSGTGLQLAAKSVALFGIITQAGPGILSL